MRQKNATSILIAMLLIISIFLTSCASKSAPEINNFDTFSREIFCSLVTSDPITLHYTLSHPEHYGIHNLPDGFSAFSYESIQKEMPLYENLYESLGEFSYENLTKSQQILYEILKDKLELKLKEKNYLSLSESLGPTTGIQAQLPILLAEFRIEDKSDLEQYFSVLKTIPTYFSSLLSLETKKKELGTLPAKSTLTHIINQCESYLDAQGSTILISSFNKKIANAGFLSEKERIQAIQKNKSLVKKNLIPAYESLLTGLANLLPFAKNNGSLCHYPQGSEYYEYLVRATTGSKKSATELMTLMQKYLDNAQKTLLEYAEKDPSLFRTCQDYTAKFHTPEQILETLKKSIAKDFPLCKSTGYTIKKVDKSLQNYLSPAFYLTPPLDDTQKNVIYVNYSDHYDNSSLFNTLAHEGYPGHLLQTCYAADKNFPILRYLLDYGGYTEGWATYAEIYAYRYTGSSTDEIKILQNNMTATLCLYGIADIGVHKVGWNKSQLASFLSPYGTFDPDSVESLYDAILDEPASYLKYSVGYIEFLLLKEEFKKEAGTNYSDMAFHTYVLNMGPASFEILQKHLRDDDNYAILG